MKERIQDLARQSAFYSLGNIAVKLGGLVLAPVLLNPEYLDVASYGYLALLLVTAQLGMFVVGMGVSSGLLRFWTHEDYRERTGTLATTALFVSTALAVAIPGIVYTFSSEDVARVLLDDADKGGLVGLVLLYVGFKIIGSVPLTVFRVQERPLAYGTVQLLEVALLVAASVYWLVFDGRGLEGVVLSYATAAGVTTLISLVVALAPMRWRFDASIVRPLIAFGAPLALASLSAWVLNSSDRYLLKWLSDPVVIASYDWASRVAGVINVLLVQSFQLAFVVVGLRRLDENDVTLHREMFRHYVVWSAWAVLGLSIFAADAMQIMAGAFNVDESYVRISGLVLMIGIGFWSYGVFQIVSSVLTAVGRTGVVAFCVGLAAAANVVLNVLWIPRYAGIGAAAATAVAFFVLTGTAAYFAERSKRVGYSWSLPALVVGLVIGLFLLSSLSTDWSPAARILFRSGVLASYVPLVVATGLYRLSEFRGGLRTILRIFGSDVEQLSG